MSLRQFVVAALALLGGAHAASSCCFVVQDEAHEVYWSEYTTQIYTSAVNLTSITTLLTPYPTTTITNYETHVYPTKKVVTTSFLVSENPVSLYTNPAYAVPQKTEILAGPVPAVTGGVTVNSPTGFWVYSTAKVFAAPAVTDANGNVACGTLSSFSAVATDAAACIPTFTGINSNAAANFDSNGGQGVQISLTTPFIHVPTRASLQISPSEVCAQGNGTENYGYPVQQLISHLAGNPFYSAQYPGIENCIPAGPTIKAVEALAIPASSSVAADPPPSSPALDPVSPASANTSCVSNCGTTETPGGGLTSSTTIIVTPPTTSSTSSPATSSSASPASTSSSFATSTSTTPTALAESTSSSSSTSSGPESAISGGLLPTTSSSSSSTSVSPISPLMEITSSSASSTSTSSSSSNGTSTSSTSSETSSSTSSSTSSTSIVSSSSTEESSAPTNSSSTAASTAGGIIGTGASQSVSPTTSGLTPVTASSVKTFVHWKLLISLMGVAAVFVL